MTANNTDKRGEHEALFSPEDLPDGFFVDAIEALRMISQSFCEHTGKLPQLQEWCQTLLFTARCSGTDLFHELPNTALVDIKAKALLQKRFTAKSGDVIAMPTKDQKWLFALYLTSNRFGTALGLFFEKSQNLKASEQLTPNTAIYTGDRFIKNGRWKIVGSKPEWLSLFPGNLEILHFNEHPGMTRSKIGEFGSAESPDGKMRQLKNGESDGFGFLGEKYRQGYLEEYLESLL